MTAAEEDVLRQVTALVRTQRLDDAIGLCRAALAGQIDGKLWPQIVTALCFCLSGTGRVVEAAAVYEEYRQVLLAVGGDYHITAAIAAHHAADVQTYFRTKSQLYAGQPVGFSVRSTVAAWCENHGIPATAIDASQNIVLPDSTAYTTDPYRCFRIPSAQMISGWDFVVTPTGHLLADTGYLPLSTHFGVFPYAIAENLNLVAHVWPDECEDVPCDALFLSAPRAFHVGHFIVDFLPRLRSLRTFAPDLKVAFPSEAPQKFVDLLAQFGIPKDRMVFCDLGKRYRFSSLVVAQHGDYLKPNPATVAFVRRSLFKSAQQPGARRIFLERDVGTRQIANTEQFDALLTEFGFERVNLATMPIAAQQTLFAEARVMIGVFGSDLLCAYFAPTGSHMIELTWDPDQDSVIRPTCQLLGIRHQFLTCPEATQTRQKRVGKDRDIVVDCDALRERLAAIVSREA